MLPRLTKFHPVNGYHSAGGTDTSCRPWNLPNCYAWQRCAPPLPEPLSQQASFLALTRSRSVLRKLQWRLLDQFFGKPRMDGPDRPIALLPTAPTCISCVQHLDRPLKNFELS